MKKKPIGLMILGVAGVLVGLISLLLGGIGGPGSIIFGGLWIIFGLKLLKSPQKVKKAILIASIPQFILFGLMIYGGLKIDRFLFMGVIFQAPLVLLNLISLFYLNFPTVTQYLTQDTDVSKDEIS